MMRRGDWIENEKAMDNELIRNNTQTEFQHT